MPATATELASLFQTGSMTPSDAVEDVLATIERLDGDLAAWQVVYGEDTDGDRTADVYRDANTVFDWEAVVSARLHLLLRSNDSNLSGAPLDYVFIGATIAGSSLPSDDRHMRREFTATVTVRNRAS